MGFTLDDDEDDFWGDATTFGCARVPRGPRVGVPRLAFRTRATLFKPAAARARLLPDPSPTDPRPVSIPRRAIDTLCKQAEEQAKSQPARNAAPVGSGVAPTSAPSPVAPPTRPSPTLDAHLRPGAGGPARAPPSAGSGGFHAGGFHAGGFHPAAPAPAPARPSTPSPPSRRKIANSARRRRTSRCSAVASRCPSATWTPCDANSRRRNDARRPRRRPRPRPATPRSAPDTPGSAARVPISAATLATTAPRDPPRVRRRWKFPTPPRSRRRARRWRGFVPRRRSRKRRRRRRADARRTRETDSYAPNENPCNWRRRFAPSEDAPPRRKPDAAKTEETSAEVRETTRAGLTHELGAGTTRPRRGERSRSRRGDRATRRADATAPANTRMGRDRDGFLAAAAAARRARPPAAPSRDRGRRRGRMRGRGRCFPGTNAPRRRRRRRARRRVRDSRVRRVGTDQGGRPFMVLRETRARGRGRGRGFELEFGFGFEFVRRREGSDARSRRDG